MTCAQENTNNRVNLGYCNSDFNFEFSRVLKIINNGKTIISLYSHDFNFNHDFSINRKEAINFVDAKEFNFHQEISFCEAEQSIFLNE